MQTQRQIDADVGGAWATDSDEMSAARYLAAETYAERLRAAAPGDEETDFDAVGERAAADLTPCQLEPFGFYCRCCHDEDET